MTATLLAGCLALATGCAAAPSPEQQRVAATTPGRPPVVSEPVTTAPTKKPQVVKPRGDAINVRKVRWTKAKPVDKGRKVQLTWWSGVEPCTVLDRVRVKETAKKVTVTLYEGTAAKARNTACIMMAVEKTTTVKLKKPLGERKLADGAKK
ncbi:hypothetical protein ABZW11_12105 [Nonomuraea sp. NPDC004580]|uniref:hypothetical protein n=1 Tax=Nonomuraea sp. NPDC004580 TaxID=3154552 RepID=UPI0033BF066E